MRDPQFDNYENGAFQARVALIGALTRELAVELASLEDDDYRGFGIALDAIDRAINGHDTGLFALAVRVLSYDYPDLRNEPVPCYP